MEKEILFADYFHEWIELYKIGILRDATVILYRRTEKQLRELIPDVTLDQMTRSVYQNLLNRYAKTRKKSTVNIFHRQIKSCLTDAFHDKKINIDPTYKAVIKGIDRQTHKNKCLHKEEARKLLFSLDLSTVNRDLFIYLLLKTGMRFGEGLALTPKDINTRNEEITINKAWLYDKEFGGFTQTKNDSSNRVVKIDWQTSERLKPLMEFLPKDEPIFVKKLPSGSYKTVYNSTFNDYLARKCEKIGIPKITMHGLRHTHASILFESGVKIQSISKRLGHASVITTQEIYVHLIKELEETENDLILRSMSSL